MRVREHDEPAFDVDFGMADSAAGRVEAHAFGRTECFLVEIDRRCCVVDREIRGDARVSVRNRFGAHDVLLRCCWTGELAAAIAWRGRDRRGHSVKYTSAAATTRK